MTVQQDADLAASREGAASQPTQVVEDIRTGASDVVSAGADTMREVAGEVGQQAKAVVGQTKRQLDQMIGQGREEMTQQLDQRTGRAAEQLRTLAQQVSALARGETGEAGPLLGYLDDAQGQIQRLAQRLEGRGPQGVVDDIGSFARRRPGIFLISAIGAGFIAGRLARAGAATHDGSTDQQPMPALGKSEPAEIGVGAGGPMPEARDSGPTT